VIAWAPAALALLERAGVDAREVILALASEDRRPQPMRHPCGFITLDIGARTPGRHGRYLTVTLQPACDSLQILAAREMTDAERGEFTRWQQQRDRGR
jgi:hypothetical protein